MASQKIITSSHIKDGKYTVVSSDKDKQLVFTVGAIVIIPRYNASTLVGLKSTNDEVEITQYSEAQVSFIDDYTTGDIRVVGDRWKLEGNNASAIIKKMDTNTYLITGNLI